MKRSRALCAFAAVSMIVACGNEAESEGRAKQREMEGSEPAVIRGTPVDPAKVPAIIVYTTGNSGCTGQFVSEDTFLTAAHCIGPGSTGKGKLHDGNSITFGNCTHNPRYRGNSTADHSICKVNGTFTAGKALVVETNPSAVKVGDVVRQVGGGCTEWGGGGFGTLRWALEKVIGVPNGSSRDITTKGTAGSDTPGAPCSGDSGGSLLSVVRDSSGKVTETIGKFLGVTSRSDTKTEGYYSSLLVSEDVAWMKGLDGYHVCGIHEDAKGCPSNEPGPGPTPGPTPPFPPLPTPPGPTPGPTPPGPTPPPGAETMSGCVEALVMLRLKLTSDVQQDGSAEIAKLSRCNAAPKPLPRGVAR